MTIFPSLRRLLAGSRSSASDEVLAPVLARATQAGDPPFDRLHPHSAQAGGREGGDRTPYHELPDIVQRLIERAKALRFEVVSWQRIRHLKDNGDRFSKAECLAIFQQAEQLGWGRLSEDMDNPS